MQGYIIPAVCKRCGELFDMSYDLKIKGTEDFLETTFFRKNKEKANLCWECRYA